MKNLSVCLVAFLLLGVLLVNGCTPEPTEDELLQSATKKFREDEFDKALDEFDLFLKKFPRSQNAPEALYAMAVIYANKKKEYSKAESVHEVGDGLPGSCDRTERCVPTCLDICTTPEKA